MIARMDLSVAIGELRAIAREMENSSDLRRYLGSARRTVAVADRLALAIAPAPGTMENSARENAPVVPSPLIPRDDLREAGEVLCRYAKWLREHNPRADALQTLSAELCHGLGEPATPPEENKGTN
ncbi:MAG: hypothetical protein ACLPQ0_05255 [Candidatus Binatus sp.]|jgi:hypothetical protein